MGTIKLVEKVRKREREQSQCVFIVKDWQKFLTIFGISKGKIDLSKHCQHTPLDAKLGQTPNWVGCE
uniref:Uncharacterized protein n=1 Tax=Romanomermis culicivorax TaxID=13658 RepID=A0A915ITM0_ROMCU